MLVRLAVATLMVGLAGVDGVVQSPSPALAMPSANAAPAEVSAGPGRKGFVGYFSTEEACVTEHDSYRHSGEIVQPIVGCYHAEQGYWFQWLAP
jgi:hypothetical protein